MKRQLEFLDPKCLKRKKVGSIEERIRFAVPNATNSEAAVVDVYKAPEDDTIRNAIRKLTGCDYLAYATVDEGKHLIFAVAEATYKNKIVAEFYNTLRDKKVFATLEIAPCDKNPEFYWVSYMDNGKKFECIATVNKESGRVIRYFGWNGDDKAISALTSG